MAHASSRDRLAMPEITDPWGGCHAPVVDLAGCVVDECRGRPAPPRQRASRPAGRPKRRLRAAPEQLDDQAGRRAGRARRLSREHRAASVRQVGRRPARRLRAARDRRRRAQAETSAGPQPGRDQPELRRARLLSGRQCRLRGRRRFGIGLPLRVRGRLSRQTAEAAGRHRQVHPRQSRDPSRRQDALRPRRLGRRGLSAPRRQSESPHLRPARKGKLSDPLPLRREGETSVRQPVELGRRRRMVDRLGGRPCPANSQGASRDELLGPMARRCSSPAPIRRGSAS